MASEDERTRERDVCEAKRKEEGKMSGAWRGSGKEYVCVCGKRRGVSGEAKESVM